MRVLVTGGSGFIGSHLVRRLLRSDAVEVLNFDKLTYAAAAGTLFDVEQNPRYHFCLGDIADRELVHKVLSHFRPDAVLHLAAESHVDRSIDGPEQFIQTNIVGTYRLLDACLQYWKSLDLDQREKFRWLQVSTDEVYGSLGPSGAFTESTAYDPHSPYSASKAAADHLVRAWHTTYGLPTIVTSSSNNYGPYQFPEKLIPHTILSAIARKPLPVYGDGLHVRDWIHVEDHVAGLEYVLRRGLVGQSYNLGANCQLTNLQLVQQICATLEILAPTDAGSYQELIRFVTDRPGHDRRYALDVSKVKSQLGWQALIDFQSGLKQTIQWYLSHTQWWKPILDGCYQLERLGQPFVFEQSSTGGDP